MPMPAKPVNVLKKEGRSHRTKKEMAFRERAENNLLSGIPLKEELSTKENEIAHREFLRIKKLMAGIEKNDDLYGAILNRYCLIKAEIVEEEKRREQSKIELEKMQEAFYCAAKEIEDSVERAKMMIKIGATIDRMHRNLNAMEGNINRKRKMLLEIEKECVMTIASALRSIPKTTETQTNPLLAILGDSA